MQKLIFIVFICMLLSGCGYFTVTQTTTKQLTSTPTPPIVAIMVENETYSTEQGSYCWSTGNISECDDMASPSELVKDYNAIQVSPGDQITVQLDRTPIDQGINVEAIDSVNVDAITMNEDSFSAPTERGTYIFTYYAKWDDNGSDTSGDSSYVFKVEVK